VQPPSSQEIPSDPAEDAFTDAFAAEFTKGMESLLKELGDGTVNLEEFSKLAAQEKVKEEEQERMFKDAWSKLIDDTDPSTLASTSTVLPNAKGLRDGSEGSFQDRIKQTMDKMKEGQSSLKVRDLQL
jgi:peroxin-19